MEKKNERKIKELINKYERPKLKNNASSKTNKEMYLKQTDRNYKDGDRN